MPSAPCSNRTVTAEAPHPPVRLPNVGVEEGLRAERLASPSAGPHLGGWIAGRLQVNASVLGRPPLSFAAAAGVQTVWVQAMRCPLRAGDGQTRRGRAGRLGAVLPAGYGRLPEGGRHVLAPVSLVAPAVLRGPTSARAVTAEAPWRAGSRRARAARARRGAPCAVPVHAGVDAGSRRWAGLLAAATRTTRRMWLWRILQGCGRR